MHSYTQNSFNAPKISHRRFEHADVVVAGHVLVKAAAGAFAVAHLAEDAAVGGGDALHREQRAVGVVPDIRIVNIRRISRGHTWIVKMLKKAHQQIG